MQASLRGRFPQMPGGQMGTKPGNNRGRVFRAEGNPAGKGMEGGPSGMGHGEPREPGVGGWRAYSG